MCGRIYIVNPLGKADPQVEQFGSQGKFNGITVQNLPKEILPTFETNYTEAEKFYLAKIGSLDKILVADVVPNPEQIPHAIYHCKPPSNMIY